MTEQIKAESHIGILLLVCSHSLVGLVPLDSLGRLSLFFEEYTEQVLVSKHTVWCGSRSAADLLLLWSGDPEEVVGPVLAYVC